MATMAISGAAASPVSDGKEVVVDRFLYAGPVEITAPVRIGRPSPVESKSLLDIYVSPDQPATWITPGSTAPGSQSAPAVNVISFDVENRQFVPATLVVEGLEEYSVAVDGKKTADKNLKLRPGTHRVDIKYASKPDSKQSLKVALKTDKPELLSFPTDGKRMYTLQDVLNGTRVSSASVSPSGRYILEDKTDTDVEGKNHSSQVLYDLKAKGMVPPRTLSDRVRWMPKSEKLYAERTDYEHKRHLVKIDPATGQEELWLTHLPEGYFYVAPDEETLVFMLTREGQKEDPDIYQILEPDDRQPGWRNRHYPALYRNGVLTPMTSGVDNVRLTDISADSKKALLMSSHSRLTKRPTTVESVWLVDLPTMKAEALVEEEGFLSNAVFSPDGTKVLFTGSPEAFDRIGCVLPADVTPSMTQQELYLMDIATRKVTPLTRDFRQNPQEVEWSKRDGNIYVRAENRDMYGLYRINPTTGKIDEIALPENVTAGFALSDGSDMAAIWGQSDSNPDRLYSLDLKTGKTQMLDDPSASRLANVKLAKCEDWNFVSERGDTIYGRYYLPDNFDPSKKYPMIVNYYGGCSPTQRAFESRYPHHVYASLGYVVYIVQPSGATGFGQEHSSRHVNTAGEGPADDIVEGAKKFIEAHPYVDASKVGCIGASYGGFTSMYLPTITDIFAASVSHAGISDHTSYWGNGYWGYSYSETSMGDNKPWTNHKLFVDQSPLFRVEKINTPILFVHGDSDTNVPPGESIQMFTAMKLLGKDAALVEVTGQDHHILEPVKRQKWQDTIFAWFAKHLQGDDTWWNTLYPAKDY